MTENHKVITSEGDMLESNGVDCPNCKKPIQVKIGRWWNCDRYQESARVRTYCCNTLIILQPVRKWRVQPYQGNDKQDDWLD